MKSIKDTLTVIRNAVTRFEQEKCYQAFLALIGGHAVIFSGVERTTLDIDVFLHSTAKNTGYEFYYFLQKYLPERFHVRFMEASKDPDDPLGHDLIIINDTIGEYPRIDILILRYKWELEGIQLAKPIANLSIPIMPVPYLIAMKLLAGGRKDELDILELLKVISDDEMLKTKELAKRIRKDRNLNTLLKEIIR